MPDYLRAEQAEQRVEELEEALRPFARFADAMDGEWAEGEADDVDAGVDDAVVDLLFVVTAADFRRARSALQDRER